MTVTVQIPLERYAILLTLALAAGMPLHDYVKMQLIKADAQRA